MDTPVLLKDQLLATKFFVPLSSHPLIERARLTTLLNQGLRCKLTLISAPAGFGKTTLLASWVQSLPQDTHVAWVSLDEDDNEPVLFWTYALTALDRQEAGLCTPLLAYLQMQQGARPPLRYILQALINTLASSNGQFLLVFDDYHVISEAEIHKTLTYLVEHLPPQLHIILTTRIDPPLPLSLLRARGEILEVRTSQLRCTQEEVLAFFKQVMDVQLHEETVREVTLRTEGWLVGLQLLGLSLQGNTPPTRLPDEVSGSQHYILDYLMEEVLQRLPSPAQTFLLYTSILERFSAPLCDAVLEQTDSQKMLEFLEHANAFVVPLDGQRKWYRYHALFAEALRSRLEQTEGPEMVTTLYLRASRWYAEQGSPGEAIRYAIAAHEWIRAAELIEQAYAFISANSEHALVRHWLEKLPIEVIRSRPRLCLGYAKTLFMIAPHTTIEHWLGDAERAVEEAKTDATNETATPVSSLNNLLGEIFAYRAIVAGYHLGDGPATLEFCQQALSYLSAENFVARAEVAYARSLASFADGDIVSSILHIREAIVLAQAAEDLSSVIAYQCRTAYLLSIHGRLHEAIQVAQQAVLLGTTPVGLLHAMVSLAYTYLANVLYKQNKLDEALDFVLQAIRLSEQTETFVALYAGYTQLMRLYLARGEIDAARSSFQSAERQLIQSYNPYRRDVHVLGDWVQFWLATGAGDRATLWLQELAQQTATPSSLARERQDVARARILLAQKKPTEALALLESVSVRAEKQQRLRHVLEIKVLQALAYQMNRQEQEALDILSHALELAEPEGYLRCFVDEGASLATLLVRLREQKHKQRAMPYIDTLLAAFPQNIPGSEHPPEKVGRDREKQSLLDSLSKRELEVLHLMAQGKSNREIAETLVLSIDTVKRHMSNIFAKLGVHSRIQAVARARTVGLLTDEV